MKYLKQFIAHKVDHRLQIQLRGKRLANVVDDGEFGVALFRLFEQALGLVEETGIFEGRHSCCSRGFVASGHPIR